MTTIKKLFVLPFTAMLLAMTVSCSNKAGDYVSLQEDFIQKWESKLTAGNLSEADRNNFEKEEYELSEKSPLGKEMDYQKIDKMLKSDEGKKMQELRDKITQMALSVKMNIPYNSQSEESEGY